MSALRMKIRPQFIGNSSTVENVVNCDMLYETEGVGPIGNFKEVEVDADNEKSVESDPEENDTNGSDSEDLVMKCLMMMSIYLKMFLFLKDSETIKFPGVSSTKLLSTGFEFKYGLEKMFDNAIDCCKRKNILLITVVSIRQVFSV
ncbi:hypothetical protein Tco_0599879 [Tanacetum coccineum]